VDTPYLVRTAKAAKKLFATVSSLDDTAMAAPSLLPDWDRAMVVTHLAAGADAARRAVEAACRGEIGELYPGGRAARDAEIEAGRAAPVTELENRLHESFDKLTHVLTGAPDVIWGALAVHPSGEVRIGPGLVVGRLREVEVHHVDLACAYGPQDWPLEWVMEEMDRAMLSLSSRLPSDVAVVLEASDTDQRWVAGSGLATEISGTTAAVFAWVIGRAATVGETECPVLKPWR
jgi:maleylpyruvate isomerase